MGGAKLCQLCPGPEHLATGFRCSNCLRIRCQKWGSCTCDSVVQIQRTAKQTIELASALTRGHCQTEGSFQGKPVLRDVLYICWVCGRTCCPLDSKLVSPEQVGKFKIQLMRPDSLAARLLYLSIVPMNELPNKVSEIMSKLMDGEKDLSNLATLCEEDEQKLWQPLLAGGGSEDAFFEQLSPQQQDFIEGLAVSYEADDQKLVDAIKRRRAEAEAVDRQRDARAAIAGGNFTSPRLEAGRGLERKEESQGWEPGAFALLVGVAFFGIFLVVSGIISLPGIFG